MQNEKIFLVKVFEKRLLSWIFGIYGLQNVSVKGLFLEVGSVHLVDLIEEALGVARNHVGHKASL